MGVMMIVLIINALLSTEASPSADRFQGPCAEFCADGRKDFSHFSRHTLLSGV